ncbi:MAG: fructosamine kinase family protein [Vicinamibacteria bacterium]
MIRGTLEEALRAALGNPGLEVLGLRSAGGGCIHSAARVLTTAGDFFAKWNDVVPPDLFLSEANGLREMAAAQSGLVVPRVVAATAPTVEAPGFIVMEHLEAAASGPGGDEELGRGLAGLHRRRSESFGFPVATYCGSTLQDNARSSDWAEFYGERRLGFLLRLIDRDRPLGASERSVLGRLVERLPDRLPGRSKPCLIHGDLWSGNVMTTTRGPALFDPACAFADREMEFGITTLFGGFSDRFWRAYQETWPLPSGWRERNPLYQLYHLLNHHLIFGGHYAAEALAIAKRFS